MRLAKQQFRISRVLLLMTKILFMGRKKIAANCLRWIHSLPAVEIVGVVTDSHLEGSVTAALSAQLGVPLLDFNSAMECASALDIDLGISVLYWRKLKGSLLLPESKHGCVNFHPALLPHYKGCAGYNLAILDGLSQWGSSCHYVDEEIDTGGILDVQKFNIDSDSETAFSLEAKTLKVMEKQFRRVIHAILSSPNSRLPVSPNIGGRYVSRAQMESLKQILPGEDPDKKSRAFWFPPYGGAWVEVNGRRVNVIPECILRSLGDPSATSLFAEPATSKISLQ